jgi:hypothetical protein
LDDASKHYDHSRVRTVNRYTDVLGWSAVPVAALTAGCGWMVELKSKPAIINWNCFVRTLSFTNG